MALFDCILYNGEKELLEIRLNETKLFNQEVTTIAICSSQTHSGYDKPNYYDDFNCFPYFNIFGLCLDKLDGENPREREAYQRNKIKNVLNIIGAKDEDIVIISDVDEIPRARQINLFKPDMKFACLMQEKYAYYLNNIEDGVWWDRARIMTGEYLKDKQPEEVRNSGYDFIITNGGWHYSWVCDPLRKLKSFSHTELDTPENIEKLERKENIWDNNKFKVIDIDLSHPEYLYRNQDKFKHLIK